MNFPLITFECFRYSDKDKMNPETLSDLLSDERINRHNIQIDHDSFESRIDGCLLYASYDVPVGAIMFSFKGLDNECSN